MTKRIEALRDVAVRRDVDAIVVSSAANRRYVSGFTGTSGIAVVGHERALFLTDFRYVEQAKKQAPAFEVVMIDQGGAAEGLAKVLDELGAKRAAFESAYVSVEEKRKWDEAVPGVEWVAALGWIEQLRAVKEPAELAAVERAVALADRAFEYIVNRLAGRTEREVAFDLEFYMRREGADSLAFPSIVASGPNGALPHAAPTDRRIDRGDLVTLDFGAIVGGYCSDLTRTVAVGPPSEKQKEVYALVLSAQEAGIAAVRPGRTGKDVDADAREVIQANGYGDRFGHGLGHGVGIEVHEDPPRLSPRSQSVLAPGMVTSVEPGIYIPEWGGVRIEDLVVVTEDGCRVLSHSPKELIQV